MEKPSPIFLHMVVHLIPHILHSYKEQSHEPLCCLVGPMKNTKTIDDISQNISKIMDTIRSFLVQYHWTFLINVAI